MATYSVYHRYHEYQRMMYMNNPMAYGHGWNTGYYNNYYSRNLCRYGCPPNSHCEWGFCECNAGLTKSYGVCQSGRGTPRPSTFDPLNIDCTATSANSTDGAASTCAKYDINLVCNTNLTTAETQGKCQCRNDMRWNTEAGECQIFMDVDCSTITYNSTVSPTVLAAVETAKEKLAAKPGNGTESPPLERTQTKEESLENSLLTSINPTNATADDIKEAFCRDIDAFSFEFQEKKDERPSLLCQEIPPTACAIAYDSSSCSGGWKLVLPEGQRKFRYWSGDWSYRNDMDLVGVRAGCIFQGFSGSQFNGNSVTVRGEQWDRWVVFSRSSQYQHMDEDIESLICSCGH